MQKKWLFQWIKLTGIASMLALAGCPLEMNTPQYGEITTESGANNCPANATCLIEVDNIHFKDTFTARPNEGYQFIGWQTGYARLCGGKVQPCVIDLTGVSSTDSLTALVNSDFTTYLEPAFIPVDHMRQYRPGDTVYLRGNIQIERQGEAVVYSAVTATVEYKAKDLSFEDKEILEAITTVTLKESGETLQSSYDFWQEADGSLFQLNDSYGNTYFTLGEDKYGLAAIWLPLRTSVSQMLMFYTMYGGHTSGPITQGTRSLVVEDQETVSVPLGTFPTYKLVQEDIYEYLFTYADRRSGTSIVEKQESWISLAKGAVQTKSTISEYSKTGQLEEKHILYLEAVRTNF